MLQKKQTIFLLTDKKYGLRYVFISYNNAIDSSIAKAIEDIFTEAKDETKFELLYRGLTECGYMLDILAERDCMPFPDVEHALNSKFKALASEYSISLDALNED